MAANNVLAHYKSSSVFRKHIGSLLNLKSYINNNKLQWNPEFLEDENDIKYMEFVKFTKFMKIPYYTYNTFYITNLVFPYFSRLLIDEKTKVIDMRALLINDWDLANLYLVDFIKNNNIDVNEKCADGKYIIHHAYMRGYYDIVVKLLDIGANPFVNPNIFNLSNLCSCIDPVMHRQKLFKKLEEYYINDNEKLNTLYSLATLDSFTKLSKVLSIYDNNYVFNGRFENISDLLDCIKDINLIMDYENIENRVYYDILKNNSNSSNIDISCDAIWSNDYVRSDDWIDDNTNIAQQIYDSMNKHSSDVIRRYHHIALTKCIDTNPSLVLSLRW